MSEIHMHMFAARERLLASFGRRGVDASGTAASSAVMPPNTAAERAGVDELAGYRDSALVAGRKIADGTSVLCLDEMQITDVVDALVVSRVFGELFRQGTVVVTTSNRPIGDLYDNGLNRDLFLPFLHLMKAHTTELELGAGVDYRTANSLATEAVQGRDVSAAYRVADDPEWLPEAVAMLQGSEAVGALEWEHEPTAFGRQLPVAKVGEEGAIVSFADLCHGDFGAADYRALASRYPAIGIQGVAAVKHGEFESAKRFVTLVDELYEARTLVAMSASDPLPELLQAITSPVIAEANDEEIEAATLAEAFFRSVNAQIRADTSSPFLQYYQQHQEAETTADDRRASHQGQSDPAAPVAAATTAHAAAVDELRFACSRAESRLHEMLSPAYKTSFDRIRVLATRQ
jgi:predicted ATPase